MDTSTSSYLAAQKEKLYLDTPDQELSKLAAFSYSFQKHSLYNNNKINRFLTTQKIGVGFEEELIFLFFINFFYFFVILSLSISFSQNGSKRKKFI